MTSNIGSNIIQDNFQDMEDDERDEIIGKTKNLGQIIIVRDLGVKRPSTVKKTSVIVKNASLQRVLVNTLSDWIGIFLVKRDQHGSV